MNYKLKTGIFMGYKLKNSQSRTSHKRSPHPPSTKIEIHSFLTVCSE